MPDDVARLDIAKSMQPDASHTLCVYVLQPVAVCCIVLHCVAVCCIVLQCGGV